MSDATSQPPNDDAPWDACPAGEIQSMVVQLNAKERARQSMAMLKSAGVVGCLAALLVVGVGLWIGPQGDISCRDCYARFEAYHLHLTDQQAMDAVALREMQTHMDDCQKCVAKYNQRYPGELALLAAGGVALASGGALLAFSRLPRPQG